MAYPTLRATVHNGQIQLLDHVQLPEDAVVFVTVMDASPWIALSGRKTAAGLVDILMGRFTKQTQRMKSPRIWIRQ